jgi:hypothetical protein
MVCARRFLITPVILGVEALSLGPSRISSLSGQPVSSD